MNTDINPEVLQLFMDLVSVASPGPGPVLPKILGVVENSEAQDYEWDGERQQLVVSLHTDQTETAFSCHMDTVGKTGPTLPKFEADKNIISTAGRFTSCLGADCRSGMAVMLYMIQNNIPGYYFFFNEEEKGLVGSQAMAKRYTRFPMGVECLIDRMISFDRKGYNEIITHQNGTRTCSDQFALALSAALNEQFPEFLDYKPSDSGGRTDSWSFRGIIPECTNISMGYHHPHTDKEVQNILYLSKVAEAALGVAWDDLPVVRDTNVIETLTYPKKTPQQAKKKEPIVFSQNYYDIPDIRFVDRQEFVAFAEARLGKFIPSFHDNPMNRRAFVKMLQYGLERGMKWDAVVDKVDDKAVPDVGTPHAHFLGWVSGFGYKVLDEFIRQKYNKPSKGTQDTGDDTSTITTGGIEHDPALWGE